MSIYAIGDIHGSFTALETLLDNLDYSSDDTFVFLGDYVNRGPKTKQVIDRLIDFSKSTNSIFLRGNHEILMIAARENENRLSDWVHYGGDTTLKSYSLKPEDNWSANIPKEHWLFIENTLPYYQISKYIFVHAGLESGKSLEEQNKHHLYWKKYLVPEMYSENEIVICGHTARKNGEIANFGHTICIDTFVHGGQWLSCINVETGDFIKTNEKKKLVRGTL